MTQHVDFPTHRSGSTLDLVLSSSPSLVSSVSDVGKLGKSDHSMLLIDIPRSLTKCDSSEQVPDWRKADLALLRESSCRLGSCAAR